MNKALKSLSHSERSALTEENITWLTPHFVGEVGFTEWTEADNLRHPRFLGLRKDKDPKDVVKEG